MTALVASTAANTDTMAELRAFLDDYWTSGLERLRDVAEAEEARKQQDETTKKGRSDGRARTRDHDRRHAGDHLAVPHRTGKHVEWQGTVADIDPRPGGVYRVLVGGESQSAGEYVEVVPNEKVVFTFGWDQEGHPIPAGSTTIEISLHPEGDKTRVRLVHRGLPDDAVSDHAPGLGPLPRPPRDRRDRRQRRARHSAHDPTAERRSDR